MGFGSNQWGLAALNGVWVKSMGFGCPQWGLAALNGIWVKSMGFGCPQWGLAALNGVWLPPPPPMAAPPPLCFRPSAPQHLRVLFDPTTGLMTEIHNVAQGLELPVTQSFYW